MSRPGGALPREGLRSLLPLIALAAPALCADRLPQPLEGVGITQRLDAEVPLDLPFVDDTGSRIHLRDCFGGRPVILALVYYKCPMLCTLVLSGLVRSLKAVSFDPGKDFDVLVVSFDPRDTPALAQAKKAACLESYGRAAAGGGWRFLTAEDASARGLADAVGFRYAFDPASGQYVHASAILVLTPQARVAKYFFGVEYSPRDLRLALVEAAESKIGSPADQLLLYCFQYDASSGKYTFTVLGAVRLASAAALLALVVFVLRALRRERRARASESLHTEAGRGGAA